MASPTGRVLFRCNGRPRLGRRRFVDAITGGVVGVGLVSQEKVGREVICRPKHRQLTAVMEFLREECCKGFDDEPVALRQAS
ncbi:MAG: Helix-turn-helix protein [Reyranella sp.]|nr:Helix-turn-helix protein [Reyranella sp.]